MDKRGTTNTAPLSKDELLQSTVHLKGVVVISKTVQQRAVYIAHDSQVAGHLKD